VPVRRLPDKDLDRDIKDYAKTISRREDAKGAAEIVNACLLI
jgi:hypothetical protein